MQSLRNEHKTEARVGFNADRVAHPRVKHHPWHITGARSVEPRKVLIVVNPSTYCRWHDWLVGEIAGDRSSDLAFRLAPATPVQLPLACRLLLSLEQLTYRVSGEHALDRLSPPLGRLRAAAADESFDFVLNLGDSPDLEAAGQRVLVPAFDGAPGAIAAITALLDGRVPYLSLLDSTGQAHVVGLPAVEEPRVLVQALDNVLSRMAAGAGALIRQLRGADGASLAAPQPVRRQSAPMKTQASPPAYFLRGIASKARARLDRLVGAAPHWHLAWRRQDAGGDRPLPFGALKRRDFASLRDDGRRYFGDPFGLVERGQLHVFCEEFPFATKKGVISSFTLDAEGRASAPKVIIEEAHHLSYPQVFHHAGAIWMVPEASAGGGVDLYRATAFPDRWERVCRLVDGSLHDATLYIDGGRFWLLASERRLNASTWDTLVAFVADRLEGPWRPHPSNPILTDARAARPAGALVRRNGALWRPAQDCSQGYGGALTWCRIDALTADTFAQTTVERTVFCAADRTIGPHTWNEAGGFEFIDLLGSRLAAG